MVSVKIRHRYDPHATSETKWKSHNWFHRLITARAINSHTKHEQNYPFERFTEPKRAGEIDNTLLRRRQRRRSAAKKRSNNNNNTTCENMYRTSISRYVAFGRFASRIYTRNSRAGYLVCALFPASQSNIVCILNRLRLVFGSRYRINSIAKPFQVIVKVNCLVLLKIESFDKKEKKGADTLKNHQLARAINQTIKKSRNQLRDI